MKNKILSMLSNNKGKFLSGQYISKELGITRSGVWKHMKTLKDKGYDIESITSKGYRLNIDTDILNAQIIKENIDIDFIDKEILYFEELDSTNDHAKRIGNDFGEGKLIITNMQTKGRGRRGKTWYAQKGVGLYFSILLKPNIHPHEASFITQVAAASISQALSNLGIVNYIKWPNDIFVNDKKVCGILTEMVCEMECINYIVVGIGINVGNDNLDPQISDVATSLKMQGYNVKRIDVLESILVEFENLYLSYIKNLDKTNVINICKKKSNILNKDIYIIKNEEKIKGKAIDINENANLVVEYENKEIEELISAQVSIRRQANEE